jgi:hypothetical protein
MAAPRYPARMTKTTTATPALMWVGMTCVLCVVACNGNAPAEGEAAGEGEGEGEPPDPNPDVQVEFRIAGVATNEAVFPTTAAGARTEVDIVVVNTGGIPVPLLSDPVMLVSGNAAFSVAQQPTAPQIDVGAQVSTRVVFAPITSGLAEGSMSFAYGTDAQARASIPLRGESTGVAAAPGIHAWFYDGAYTSLPDFSTLTPASDATLPNISIGSRAGTDNFAVRFVGLLNVPAAGDWTFFSTSDDGSFVILDDVRVVDHDGLHGPTTEQGAATLTAGFHRIEVQFFEAGGGEVLSVEWEGPGTARATIPDAALLDNQ